MPRSSQEKKYKNSEIPTVSQQKFSTRIREIREESKRWCWVIQDGRDDGGESGEEGNSTRTDTRKSWDFRSKVNSAKEKTNSSITRHARAPHFPILHVGQGEARRGAAMVNHQSRVLSAFPSSSLHRKRSHPFLHLYTIAASWWTKILGECSSTVRTLREFSGIINAWNLEFSPRSKQTERKKVSERKEWRRKEFDFRWHDICTIFDRACVSKGEESSIFLWKRVTFNRNLICNLVSPFLSLFACHFFLLFSLLFFFFHSVARRQSGTRERKRENGGHNTETGCRFVRFLYRLVATG